MTALDWMLRRVKISTVRRLFSRMQILSSAYLAFAHGSNDSQKFMGIFALALVLGGVTTTFSVPIWVVLLCGVVMDLGTASGGWRIIRTIGFKLTKRESVHGFASQVASGISILVASS
jgi:inorganic phosphate transporter, PiT family